MLTKEVLWNKIFGWWIILNFATVIFINFIFLPESLLKNLSHLIVPVIEGIIWLFWYNGIKNGKSFRALKPKKYLLAAFLLSNLFAFIGVMQFSLNGSQIFLRIALICFAATIALAIYIVAIGYNKVPKPE